MRPVGGLLRAIFRRFFWPSHNFFLARSGRKHRKLLNCNSLRKSKKIGVAACIFRLPRYSNSVDTRKVLTTSR